jgi:hypothetical protein
MLFVPGGALIDLAVGVAMAADAWDQAETIGRAANTSPHVDEGLMSQGQAQMAKIMAVVSTVLAVAGVAASAFKVLRVAGRFAQVTEAFPEMAAGERMTLARAVADKPDLLKTLAAHGGDEAVASRLRGALQGMADNPKALTKALEGIGEFTKLRKAESEVLKDTIKSVAVEEGKHFLRFDKAGRIWICSEICTDATEVATKVLGGHSKILANPEAVRLVQNLADNGMEVEVMSQIVQAAAADKKGIKDVLVMLARLQMADKAGIRGVKVVLSDLAQGGGKAQGARFVLNYLEKKGLWTKVDAFEVLESAGELGGRRYDAIIEGWRYQFKDWGEFSASTFLDQIKKDLAVTTLDRLRWVFAGGRLGSKADIVKLATAVLKRAAKSDKAFAADAGRIIAGLKNIIEVH